MLPAILTLLGHRVDALTPRFLARRAERDARPADNGFRYRLPRLVSRVAGRMAVAATVLLVAAGIPFAGVQFTAVDARVLPASASARQVDHALRTDFPPHRDTPVTLAVHGAEEAQRITAAAADPPGAAAVRPPRPLAGDVYAVDVISTAPPTSDTSQDLVRALRALDGDALVTGATARYLDLQASLGAQLALMVAIVAPSRSPCCSP